jgi:hypothetical protein
MIIDSKWFLQIQIDIGYLDAQEQEKLHAYYRLTLSTSVCRADWSLAESRPWAVESIALRDTIYYQNVLEN